MLNRESTSVEVNRKSEIKLEKGQRINLEKETGAKLTNFCVGCNWGAIDAGFGSSYLARMVGQKKAREIWFLCKQYSAKEAEEMGMETSGKSNSSYNFLAQAGCIHRRLCLDFGYCLCLFWLFFYRFFYKLIFLCVHFVFFHT